MKLFIFLTLFASQAFAGVCDHSYTPDFMELVELEEYEALDTSAIPARFTKLEKKMIVETMKISNESATAAEHLRAFSVQPGAGRVAYFSVEGKKIAYVHYWPEESETGAFFEVSSGKPKMIAVVYDSHIDCNL